MEDVADLRRCVIVIAGGVDVLLNELCGVLRSMLSICVCVSEFTQYTGPRHIKSEIDMVLLGFFPHVALEWYSLL